MEIGKLADLHAVEPHLPAQAPGAQGGRFPVVFHKADVVVFYRHSNSLQALQIEVLDICGCGLDDHLKLVVVSEAVWVFAIASVFGPSAGLWIGDGGRFGAECTEEGGRVKGSGAHFHIIGLDEQASRASPKLLQREDHILKSHLSSLFIASQSEIICSILLLSSSISPFNSVAL